MRAMRTLAAGAAWAVAPKRVRRETAVKAAFRVGFMLFSCRVGTWVPGIGWNCWGGREVALKEGGRG
jgi:hypothetical protein